MSNLELNGIFPLPLNAFERFTLKVDEKRHPSIFLGRWTFTGTIDRPAFEDSIADAQRRHPILHSVIRYDRTNGPQFVFAEAARPQLDWGPGSAPITLPATGEGVCPRQEPGVRIWVRQDGDRAAVMYAFHHTFVDVVGASRFVSDLMAGYARRMGGEAKAELAPLTPERLPKREYHMKFGPEGEAKSMSGPTMLNWTARMFGAPTVIMSSPDGGDGRTRLSPFPDIHVCQLDTQQKEMIRKAAVAQGVFSNDLLIAALFITLLRWNRHYGRLRPSQMLRVAMPVDMRGRQDIALPAANVVSIAFLDRLPKQCREIRELVAAVRTETIRIRNEAVGSNLIQSLSLIGMVQGWLGVLVRGTRSLATAVLSNGGDQSRRLSAFFPKRDGKLVIGNLVLEDLDGVPPLWRGTRAAFGVGAYAGHMTISLRCDPWYFAPATTEKLLKKYIEVLFEVAAACAAGR